MSKDKNIEDPGKQIVELLTKLESMPEYNLFLRIRSLDASLYAFKRNYEQLNSLLTKHSDVREAVRLKGVGKKPEMREFLYEVARLLHNFVASVKSLIEHTRIIYREIEGAKVFPEYQKEVDKYFTNNPLAQFVEDLRDYCLHYKLPTISSVLHYSRLAPTPVFESKIELPIEDLKKYSGWSPLGRKYLLSQTILVNLLNVINEYYALVEGFHSWFRLQQQRIHSDALAKLASLQGQLEDLEKKA